MNHQSSPTPPHPALASASAALSSLLDMYAGLPTPPYVVIHTFEGVSTVDLQLDTPYEFEQWCTALTVPAEAIDLLTHGGTSWLAAVAVFQGVKVKLSGHGIALPPGLEAAAAGRTGGASE
ncbi:hypothetical protein ACGFZK_32640 [Streptomyces sp. NPDC048257]|uniref:hypothetical protein n=1 Tax=Streptomyces sp. NPDC048257 TaxID=3365526 RepID=UPI003712BE32